MSRHGRNYIGGLDANFLLFDNISVRPELPSVTYLHGLQLFSLFCLPIMPLLTPFQLAGVARAANTDVC